MKLKWLSFFLIPALIVPIAASPIFNGTKKDNNFKSLADAAFPLTKYGWSAYLNESKLQSTSFFQKIQDETLAMSHKPDKEKGETVGEIINKLANHIAKSNEYQMFVLYKLREFNANVKMFQFTKNIKQYSIEESDLENLLAFKYLNQTPTNPAFVIWDHVNNTALPLTNIQLRVELRNLVYGTFKRVNEIYEVDLNRFLPELMAGTALFGFSIESNIALYESATDDKKVEILENVKASYNQVQQTINLLTKDLTKDLKEIFNESKNDQEIIDSLNENQVYQILQLLNLKLANISETLYTMTKDESYKLNEEKTLELQEFSETGLMPPLFAEIINPLNSEQKISWKLNSENPTFTIKLNKEFLDSNLVREFKLLTNKKEH